jgi:hypothetical protein
VAGTGYLIIFVLAIFSNFVVRTGLVDPDRPAATFENIQDSEFLFRMGMVGFLIIFALDVVIAWALYVLFRSVHRDISLVTAWFRLIYTAFLGVALIFFFLVLDLIRETEAAAAFEQGELDAQVTLLMNAFNYAWLIGLVCFGVHVILLGFLLLKSGWAPRVLGVVLYVAGAAYILDTFANATLSNYADVANVFLVLVAVPAVIGELAFAIWLLAKGGKQQDIHGLPRVSSDTGRGSYVD